MSGGEDEVRDHARLALRRIVHLRGLLDELEAALVIRARGRETTWRELGADLGISAQAAFRRHRARDPQGPMLDARREEHRRRNLPPWDPEAALYAEP